MVSEFQRKLSLWDNVADLLPIVLYTEPYKGLKSIFIPKIFAATDLSEVDQSTSLILSRLSWLHGSKRPINF